MASGEMRTAPGRAETSMKRGPKQDYLRGRLPLDWISAAARLPGRSLHAGLVIWILRGLRNSRVIALSNTESRRFGLDRNAKYRALVWLERAGLVKVERKLGRAPVVTILDCREDA